MNSDTCSDSVVSDDEWLAHDGPSAPIRDGSSSAEPEVSDMEDDVSLSTQYNATDELMFDGFDHSPIPPIETSAPVETIGSKSAERSRRLYTNWSELLPHLREPVLRYLQHGASIYAEEGCSDISCTRLRTRVQLVEFLGSLEREFYHCQHDPLPIQLVRYGFFPSSPIRPHSAFSIRYLEFYHHMFEHATESAQACAAGLTGFHRDLGFLRQDEKVPILIFFGHRLTISKQGKVIHEGYHRPLQYALQWYDVLYASLQSEAACLLRQYRRQSNTHRGISELLKDRCPSCFEEAETGRSLAE